MRLLLLITALSGIAIGTGSCRNGGETDPAEYIRRIVEARSDCEPGDLDDPTIEEIRAETERELRELDDISPPKAIANEHRALVNGFRAVLAELNAAEDLSVLRESTQFADIATEATKANDDWFEALEENFGVVLFTNEGASMEPAFSAGEALAFSIFDSRLDRWDLIVFEFPLDPDRTFFKRVVGLPGEEIAIHDETIFVNGEPVAGDEYHLATANYTYGPRTVPGESYFVLGDNRRTSFDSHAWGSSCRVEQMCEFVPARNILGELPPDTTGAYCRQEP